MDLAQYAVVGWLIVGVGGVLALALAFAYVLTRRRRPGEPSRLEPSPEMRAAGRALHPEDMVNIIAGIWLFISPWAMAPYATGWLTLSNGLFGALIAIFSLAAVYRLMPIQELIIAVLASWIFISPWVLTPPSAAVAWSNWIAAAVVMIASISSMVRMPRQPTAPLSAHREGG